MPVAGPSAKSAFWRVVVAAAIISTVVAALQAYPIHIAMTLSDLSKHRSELAHATAIANLAALVATVVAGIVADRFGAGRTVAFGILAATAGIELFRVAQLGLEWNAVATLFGIGLGAAGSGLLACVVAQRVASSRLISGVLLFAAIPLVGNAMWSLATLIGGGDVGPMGAIVRLLGFVLGYEGVHRLLSAFGWQGAAAIGAVLLLLCWPLSRPHTDATARPSLAHAVRSAVRLPGYWLLAASSFLAGATTFMSVHQHAYLLDHGLDFRASFASLSAFFFGGLVGIVTVACARGTSMKNCLAMLSVGRAAAFLCFLLLPLTSVGALFDFFLLGAFLLPVAPLTTVLTAKLVGTRWLAALFGVLFLLYGVGTAFGAYMAGLTYDWTKSYDLMLCLACVMSIAAALANFFIREPAHVPETSHAMEPASA